MWDGLLELLLRVLAWTFSVSALTTILQVWSNRD